MRNGEVMSCGPHISQTRALRNPMRLTKLVQPEGYDWRLLNLLHNPEEHSPASHRLHGDL